MNPTPTQVSEVKAFLFALYQLDSPLPESVQGEINQININISYDIDKLYNIANSHPPLAKLYEQVLDILDTRAEVRSKGIDDIPEYKPEPFNTEIENVSRAIELALVEFDQKVDNNKLIQIMAQLTKALNSVKTAKDVIQTILSSN
jgi:hypothetical protein